MSQLDGFVSEGLTSARSGPAGPGPLRRTGVDPVKALMHRHRELCERAVDPLEIAAGLEAHGVTDRTAARFRHRDVFSLAEEMYARVPRDREGDRPERPEDAVRPTQSADAGRGTRSTVSVDPGAPAVAAADSGDPVDPTSSSVLRPGLGWFALTLLPGVLGTATVVGLRLTHGQPRLVTAVVGALAVALAVRALLRRGRLPGAEDHRSGVWVLCLVGYALLGDGLLGAALGGGPDGLPTGAADGPWPAAVAPVLALTLACAPAAWCARLFAVHARRRLETSRGLEEFGASVRPLLFGVLALFLGVLAALLALTGAVLDQPAAHAQGLTLGALLLLARLLTAHGSAYAPALVLTGAATGEAMALAGLFASRLPGCEVLAVPVETLVTAWGVGSVPAVACGVGALVLLPHATRRLARASAHAHQEPRR